MRPLAGRAVLELSSRYAAVGLAGAELAAAGAEVTLVEPATGHPWRRREPTIDGTGAFFTATAAGKRSALAELGDAAVVEQVLRAAAGCDVLLAGDDAPPELLGALGRVALVGVVSGWGTRGRWAGRPASEAGVQALSGYAAYLGRGGERPRRVGADVAEHAACRLLVHGILAALLAGRRPETVSVSLLGAACALKTIMWAARTDPDAWEGFHLLAATKPPEHGWRTRDGAVTLDFLTSDEARWHALMERWGIADGFSHLAPGEWVQTVGLGDRAAELRPVYERATGRMTGEAVIRDVEDAGGLGARYLRHDELVRHEQVAAERALLGDVRLGARTLTRVRPVGLLDADAGPRAVPALGSAALPDGERLPGGEGDMHASPLAGLRVVDFSQGAVGPWAATLLARLGADVVKIDPPRGDFILAVGPRSRGRPTTFGSLNVGKRCERFDAREAADAQRLRAMVRDADVLVENLRPGAMARLGLGYADVAAENPGIVYLSSTGYGQSGPLAASRCTDPQMQAFGGLAAANDPDDPESLRYYAIIDMVTALAGAELLLLALLERARTGRGSRVTTSMLHAGMTLQARQLAEHLGAGRLAAPVTDGPLRALDGWFAVTAVDDDAFRRLVEALECPELAAAPRFDGEAARLRHRDELLTALEAVTAACPRTWWLRRLARAGVPAAPYLTDEEASEHGHVRAEGAIESVPAGEDGPLDVGATPWRFERTRLEPIGAAPMPAAGWPR